MTGYTHCACRDCFEVAIGEQGKALCHNCGSSGCEPGDHECQADPCDGCGCHMSSPDDCIGCEHNFEADQN
jgi:hypothetical protein